MPIRPLKTGFQLVTSNYSIGLCTAVIGVVAAALDHPEIYLAYGILSGIITGFNLVTLCYFVYVAIRDSMNDVYLPQRYII